jgi:glycosyltransferase involved in cell wall biosynthesis
MLREILRHAGWRSEIFAEAIHDDLASEAYKHWMYPDHAADGDVAIYQFSTSSAVAGYLAERSLPLILDFHNFTGPKLFAGWEPHTEERAARAADELSLLAPRSILGLADSRYNEATLQRAGCRRTAVVPVLVDYGRVTSTPDPRVSAELQFRRQSGGADILFVGRIVPSKRQHELVKALWVYHRLYDPLARLNLVGGTSSYEYLRSLRMFIDELELSRAVRLTGEVSDAALAAYFDAADVYLSLSVHEGFGVPLVEAMAAGVPVVARRAGAVAETVGDSALLLESADHAYVAATLHRVLSDGVLHDRLATAGRDRSARFGAEQVAQQVVATVAQVVGAPQ